MTARHRWLPTWLVASPVHIAFVLNAMIALLAIAAVTLHLNNRHEQLLGEARTRATNIAQSQALLIGEHIQLLKLLTGKLRTQLTIHTRLGPVSKTSGEDVLHAKGVHELLTQYKDLIPHSIDVLLLTSDGHVSSANDVLDRHETLESYCQ